MSRGRENDLQPTQDQPKLINIPTQQPQEPTVFPSHLSLTQLEPHQQAASPRPSPTCPRAQTCRFRPQEASLTSPFLRPELRDSRLCLVSPVWALAVRRFPLALVAWRGILLPLEVDLPVGWISGGDYDRDLGVGSYVICF